MRRPLFWVCICLVLLSAIRLWTDVDLILLRKMGQIDSSQLPKGESILLTGQVYQKESNKFYLKAITIQFPVEQTLKNTNLKNTNPSNSNQSNSNQSNTNQSNTNQGNSNQSNSNQGKTNQANTTQANTTQANANQGNINQANTSQGNITQANINLSNSNNIYSHSTSFQEKKLVDYLVCEWEESESLKLGSVITVKGIFWPYEEAANPGEFNQKKYYASLKIGGRLKKCTLISVSSEYSYGSEALYRLRQGWKERLYHVFPQKEASILATMLLGDKKNLDSQMKELYQDNGIVHILSISGLHITIIGMGIYRLLRKLQVAIPPAAICGGVLLVLYGVMTGMSVSTIRAIGMYSLRMISLLCGRTYDLLTSLAILAALMTVVHPGYLNQGGFLLSFGAVLGIGIMYPALWKGDRLLPTFPKRYRAGFRKYICTFLEKGSEGLALAILSSIAITLTTLPLQLWLFYEIPTYTVFINLCILPFMSILLSFGLLAMLLPGAGILGTVSCVILYGYECLCNMFQRLPYSMWNPGKPRLWQMLLYYGLWLGLVVFSKNGKRNLRAGKTLLLLGMIFVISIKLPRGEQVNFLSVGQGDCTVIQVEDGGVYLFDCGSSTKGQVGKYTLLPFLKYYGIGRINGVFASHGDLDHINGLTELFSFAGKEQIKIDKIILPALSNTQKEISFGSMLQLNNVEFISAGQFIAQSGINILCLHPPYNMDKEGNESSQCFYIELTKGKEVVLSLLLTGDVEGKGEEMLCDELKRRGIEEVMLLKVAHHGSKYATSEKLLDLLELQAAIISCGKNNSYGHPHKEVLMRLEGENIPFFRTDEIGAITVKRFGDNLKIF